MFAHSQNSLIIIEKKKGNSYVFVEHLGDPILSKMVPNCRSGSGWNTETHLRQTVSET